MIKRLTVIVFVLGLLPQISSAQVESFEMGLKFGVNIADIEGDETKGFNPRTSIHIGLAAEIPVNEYLAIHPELFYSFQGVQYKSELPNFEDEILRVDYIYLPVMLKYYPFYVVPGFSIEVGPQVGYLASAVRELKNNFLSGVTERSNVDAKDVISDIDYGANIGLGYQFEMGVFFQARYSLGLANIVDDNTNDLERRHSIFQLSTGIKF